MLYKTHVPLLGMLDSKLFDIPLYMPCKHTLTHGRTDARTHAQTQSERERERRFKYQLCGCNPANTQRRRNVVKTSLQRHDVAATL